MDVQGLSREEAQLRLKKYGPNDVAENRKGAVKKWLAPLYSPISLMLLAAAGLSWLNQRAFDAWFIIALYLVNYSIQKWQEFKADKAIQELQKKLSFDVWTLRSGRWEQVNAKELVPGDLVRLGLGSIFPADGVVTQANNLQANESVLTGESLPKEKKEGDKVYSGSFIATGNVQFQVTATGRNTYFGKTIFSIEPPRQKSILERDILTITRFLTLVSLAAVALLTLVLSLRTGFDWQDLLTLDLSLVIAGIPIALPAVMAVILSIGAASLTKKLVVVRRLSALQDLANVNLLLTDKTGTLTKNEISVANVISYHKELSTDDVVRLAGYAAGAATPDSIDQAVLKRCREIGGGEQPAEVLQFIPFDSGRKHSTVRVQRGQEQLLVSVGAAQVVRQFDDFGSEAMERRFDHGLQDASEKGYRVLAVAVKHLSASEQNPMHERGMEMAGILLLADPLDEHSKEVIGFMRQQGINVKMVTGDNYAIAERVAGDLGLWGQVLNGKETAAFYGNKSRSIDDYGDIAAFSEILPKDKYELVRRYRQQYVVASTGDGINDLPALKSANVGIAVSNAVSALKSMADIMLLGRGLEVIKDAIIESRKIFTRLYNYTVYRISESFRLIITILALGVLYGSYPLVPLQIILLAFLNDIPIISLAFDRVKIISRPASINVKSRFTLSLLFGLAGIANSLCLFWLTYKIWHLPLGVVQTMFFLKLTVSGHMLIFVAHTKERWWKFLPAAQVIIATLATQAVATLLAVSGFMMPADISFGMAAFVWIWSFVWMQVTEFMKTIAPRI